MCFNQISCRLDALAENILQEVKQGAVLHPPFKQSPLCLSFSVGKEDDFCPCYLKGTLGPQRPEHFSAV